MDNMNNRIRSKPEKKAGARRTSSHQAASTTTSISTTNAATNGSDSSYPWLDTCTSSTTQASTQTLITTKPNISRRQLLNTDWQTRFNSQSLRRQEYITGGGQTAMERWIVETPREEPWTPYRRN